MSNPSTLKPTKQLYKLHNCNMQLLHGIHGLRCQVKIVEASIPFIFKTIQGLQYCVICYRASIIVKFVPHKSVERQLMRNREATALIDFWITKKKQTQTFQLQSKSLIPCKFLKPKNKKSWRRKLFLLHLYITFGKVHHSW